jgi:hypothetical protein
MAMVGTLVRVVFVVRIIVVIVVVFKDDVLRGVAHRGGILRRRY